MEKRKFGNTDMNVSVLGFGGAEIGYEGATLETVTELLNGAIDAGLNVIDTAIGYHDSEKLIGQAVGNRRGEFYLFTKCGRGGSEDAQTWSAESLMKDIETSLSDLRTDHVDLVQIHSCPEEFLRKGEVIETVQRMRERGYARYIGYSGDGAAARYAIESGAFDALQTSISVADQEAIDLLLPAARERNMGVIAKRPIANAAWRTGRRPESPYHHEYYDRLLKLDYDFLKKPLDEAVAVALRFTLSQPGVHTAIVGTKRPGRWRENARLLEAGPLPADEIDRIRRRWKEVADATWVGQV